MKTSVLRTPRTTDPVLQWYCVHRFPVLLFHGFTFKNGLYLVPLSTISIHPLIIKSHFLPTLPSTPLPSSWHHCLALIIHNIPLPTTCFHIQHPSSSCSGTMLPTVHHCSTSISARCDYLPILPPPYCSFNPSPLYNSTIIHNFQHFVPYNP